MLSAQILNRECLLSIGRLTYFKTYNLYMPRIIRQLDDDGYDVEWHVIGGDEPDTPEGI